MSDLSDAWEAGRADVDDDLVVGDIALLVGRIHYRGKASGGENETPVGWVVRFRNGKLASFRAFRELEQALEAVGLWAGYCRRRPLTSRAARRLRGQCGAQGPGYDAAHGLGADTGRYLLQP
jgi:hypothetical protein